MTIDNQFSAIGEWFNVFTLALEEDQTKSYAELTIKALMNKQSLATYDILIDIDQANRDILSILNQFSGKKFGPFNLDYIPIDHITLLSKLYIIQWSTLTDLVAIIINQALNLGISDQDINWGIIFRNKHVLSSNIPQIHKKHSRQIDYNTYNKQRNDIIHRGKISDQDINNLKIEKNKIISNTYSLFTNQKLTDDEYQTLMDEIKTKELNLAKEKQSQYSNHHSHTMNFISDIIKELAKTSTPPITSLDQITLP